MVAPTTRPRIARRHGETLAALWAPNRRGGHGAVGGKRAGKGQQPVAPGRVAMARLGGVAGRILGATAAPCRPAGDKGAAIQASAHGALQFGHVTTINNRLPCLAFIVAPFVFVEFATDGQLVRDGQARPKPGGGQGVAKLAADHAHVVVDIVLRLTPDLF